MTAVLSLTHRELRRFYRQRSRIIGSLATPIVFWVLLGTGLTAAFPQANGAGGRGFIEFFFPANLVMTLLFTSIFSTISIIEDRHQGFLQGVLVSPVSAFSLVGGKVFGGATIATFQGLLFLALAPAAGFHLSATSVLLALGAMVVMGFTLTAIGFLFAWRIDSVQGFHSMMNLLLFPMWLISGAFFPLSSAPYWLQWIMKINPLTYGVLALQQSLYVGTPTGEFFRGVVGCFLFGVVFYFLSMITVTQGGRK